MNPAPDRMYTPLKAHIELFVFKRFPPGKPPTPTNQVGGHAFPENALERIPEKCERFSDKNTL